MEARAEFDDAFDWYEEQRPELGIDFLMCVDEALERIASFPEAHEVIFGNVRRAVVCRFPYLILYQIELHQVVILAVFHSKREPQVWKNRL